MGGSFKSGAGSLDFEENGESDDEDESIPEPAPDQESTTTNESTETDETTEDSQQDETSTETASASNKYPYFVRRNSVGDERSTRMELHVRDDVADQEGEYLSELADKLDTDRVAKTDAREFALKLAHENPEEVARLMRDEGYGELS
ncbi:acyl-CoA dehydrogenase [Halorussus salinisoli]|uniref:acyl-CoA dehydrogenase n=1 Tax=Halorussus salinisoli TaxID=2558242 RepID=UPI0010C163F7|nr:acyl-CoA dehydrogenase [Halorussus salinisoli]